MPLIGDFVDNRWTDAKEELRRRDPSYVRQIESTGQSEQEWLRPASGLPPEWHNLLAACDELHLLASMLQAAAMGLTPFPYLHGDLTNSTIGHLLTYNSRSWFVHAKALAERTKDVIRKTTEVYIHDIEAANAIAECHCKFVKQRVEEHRVQFDLQGTITELRNEYGHGKYPSWAHGMTKGDDDLGSLWEACIASDLTPRRRLEEGFFPAIEVEARSGKYDSAVEDTKDVFDRVACILHELEEDIARHNAQADFQAMDGQA